MQCQKLVPRGLRDEDPRYQITAAEPHNLRHFALGARGQSAASRREVYGNFYELRVLIWGPIILTMLGAPNFWQTHRSMAQPGPQQFAGALISYGSWSAFLRAIS